jgi:hypothetical protein
VPIRKLITKKQTWLMATDDDLAEGFLQHNQLYRKFGTHRHPYMTMPSQELDPSPNGPGIRAKRLLIHTALEVSLAKVKLCRHVRWIQVNGYIKINDGAAQKTCAAVV